MSPGAGDGLCGGCGRLGARPILGRERAVVRRVADPLEQGLVCRCLSCPPRSASSPCAALTAAATRTRVALLSVACDEGPVPVLVPSLVAGGEAKELSGAAGRVCAGFPQ
jgi:hypothetical protein